DNPLLPGARISLAEVAKVGIGRGELCAHQRTHGGSVAELHVTVPDSWMSTRHLELTFEAGQWSMRDCDSKNGSYLNGKRCVAAPLCDGDVFHTGNTSFLFRSEAERSHLDPADVHASELRSLPTALQTLSSCHA